MKNVYKPTVASYSNIIRETCKAGRSSLKARASHMRVSMAVILGMFLMFNGNVVNAQNCPVSGTTILSANENTYYPGTQAAVAAGTTSITLGPIGAGPNFGNAPIATGDIVLIIQMQGAQLFVPAAKNLVTYGGNANVGTGMITTNLIAGYMEFAVATNAVPVGGGILNISAGLTYNYAYAAWGATGQYTYQVIRVPQHFNIQLGATITTPQWNGSTGGVTVISAVNQLDFNGQTINASGAGFRGGGGRALSGAAGTNKTDYYSLSTVNAHASKAEGVAGTPRYITVNNALVDNGAANEGYPSGSYARGGAGNAGGGASDSRPASNDENAGGGGGGNGGMGGLGGNGWFSFGLSGGHGGTPLQTYGAGPIYPVTTYYSPSRLIMGGGGGAGTSNDATGIPCLLYTSP